MHSQLPGTPVSHSAVLCVLWRRGGNSFASFTRAVAFVNAGRDMTFCQCLGSILMQSKQHHSPGNKTRTHRWLSGIVCEHGVALCRGMLHDCDHAYATPMVAWPL
jgi:hypothetical protein